MPKGLSIHIGLNAVDPDHYSGWSGPLNACVNDATDMQALARDQSFETRILLDSDATRDAVSSALSEAIRALDSGDMLLVSYSGHGGQVPDWNDDEEDDNEDETWCLYDGQLVDDELWEQWLGAREGVRIVVVSDSCHSGTVSKMRPDSMLGGTGAIPEGAKCMPYSLSGRVYRDNRAHYDPIISRSAPSIADLRASVLLLSGCQDREYSYDGLGNGQFTGALLRTWKRGQFSGDYRKFHRQVRDRIRTPQTPNLFPLGPDTAALVAQKPFTVSPT